MEKKEFDLDELEKAAGGISHDDEIGFRLNVYKKDTYVDYIPILNHRTTPAFYLRQCVRAQFNARTRDIRVYLPSGKELDYAGTFESNGLKDGVPIKAVIDD